MLVSFRKDCVIASYAEVAGSSPTDKEQKFVPFYCFTITSFQCFLYMYT
mgnify:CR=1 FL=1